VTIRHFGTLKSVVAACTASVSATGNNLAIEGDNMRRWVVARLVIDDELSELREFDFDPVEEAQKRRSDLVAAALTIVRAYWVAGERKKRRMATRHRGVEFAPDLYGAFPVKGAFPPRWAVDR
jgi:hypothetical protein